MLVFWFGSVCRYIGDDLAGTAAFLASNNMSGPYVPTLRERIAFCQLMSTVFEEDYEGANAAGRGDSAMDAVMYAVVFRKVGRDLRRYVEQGTTTPPYSM